MTGADPLLIAAVCSEQGKPANNEDNYLMNGQFKSLGSVDGGKQQAPHGGRRHHPGGKAQHRLLKPGLRFPGEKKHHGGAQGGHTFFMAF